VNEDDAVRGDDSFRAFEEVLQKAVESRCDFLLLGGDLFHDNQPSRSTMHKTVRILKKYCMSDRPVSFQILSNQAENFPSTG
jgi:double-strand break repair protein MRE11